MLSSVETGVQRNVFQIFCSVFREKSVFCIKLQKLTQDGKLKICSDDPLLHANRFYAYFYGGKRVVFYIYTLYILRNCSLLCVTASRPWLSSDRFQNLYIILFSKRLRDPAIFWGPQNWGGPWQLIRQSILFIVTSQIKLKLYVDCVSVVFFSLSVVADSGLGWMLFGLHAIYHVKYHEFLILCNYLICDSTVLHQITRK